jgi:hypothetical protein
MSDLGFIVFRKEKSNAGKKEAGRMRRNAIITILRIQASLPLYYSGR